MKNIPYLIHDFIGWAFYGNINYKPIDLVYKCYLIYCTNFGIDEVLTNKALSTNICKVCGCMIINGRYCIGGYNEKDERR